MDGIRVAEMGFRRVLEGGKERWKEKRDGFWIKNEEKKGILGLVMGLREVDESMVKKNKGRLFAGWREKAKGRQPYLILRTEMYGFLLWALLEKEESPKKNV